MNIARTTLSSKILTQYKDYFANLAVDAVLRLKVRRGYVNEEKKKYPQQNKQKNFCQCGLTGSFPFLRKFQHLVHWIHARVPLINF